MGKRYPYRKIHSFIRLLVTTAFLFSGGDSFAQVTRTWNGGGGDSFWTNRLNWGGTAPVSGNLLLFEGSAGLSPINTFTSGTTFNGLSFGSTAGAFTLSGYPFTINGSMSNSSAQNQVINNNIIMPANTEVSSSGGELSLNGVVSGAFNFTKTGSGSVRLGGQNTFTGTVTVSDGTLRLAGGDSTLAGRLTMVVNGGTLDLGSNIQLVGEFSGTGGKIKGNRGTLYGCQTVGNYTFAGDIGDNDTLNFFRGGVNNANLNLTGDNTTRGVVTCMAGSPTGMTGLTLNSSGKLSQLSRINLQSAAMKLDNSSTSLSDRFSNSAAVYLNGGAINFVGSSASNTSETLGVLTLLSGQNNISITNNSSSYSTNITFTGLNRNKGAVVNINRLSSFDNFGRSGNYHHFYITSTPGALGGIIPQTVNGVVPGFFGCERDLVSYVDSLGFGKPGTVGFPPATVITTNTTLGSPTAVDETSNVMLNASIGGTVTVPSGGIKINAISLRANNLAFTNADDTLSLTAGVFMGQGTGGAKSIGTTSVPGVLTTPRSELFMNMWHNSGGDLVVNSKIIGNTMVVLSGDGSSGVNFTFTNSGNSYTGGTVVNGNGGATTTLNLNSTSGSVFIPNASNPDSGLIINDDAQVVMSQSAGQIGSANKVTLNGKATLTLTGNNTLAGLNFNVYHSPNVTLGTILTLTGGINVTHSNPFYRAIIQTGTLDLNGNNNFPIYIQGLPCKEQNNFATINEGGLTISGIIANGGITKTGTGVLVLTSSSSTFTGPITINEGTIRFNHVNANTTIPSSVIMNGGTLSTRALPGLRAITITGGLTLSNNGIFELSSNLSSNTNSLNFGSCSTISWTAGKTLLIRNWNGRAGMSGTGTKVFFGSTSSGLTSSQLSQISFEGYPGGAMLLSTGELVPTAIGPYEPMVDRIVAGDGSATVSFFSPNNRGSAITNYEYSVDNGLTWIARSPASTTSPFTITGLTNGVNYLVRIRAVNANGAGTMSNPETIIPSSGLSRVTYSATALNVTSSGTGSEIQSSGTLVEANRFGSGSLSQITLDNGIVFGNSSANMIRPSGPNFQAVWEWNTTSVQTYQTGWSSGKANNRATARGMGLVSGTAMHSLMTSAWWMNYSASRSDLIIPNLTPGNIYRLQLISEAPSDASVYVEDGSPYTWTGTNPSVLSMTWVARDNEMFMRLSRKVTDRTSSVANGQGGEVFFNGYVLQTIGVAGSDTTVTACGSFTWNDSTYTASTNTSKTFTRSGQLDSVAYLNLTIIPITSNTTTAAACDSYTWSVNGTTYTQSGTYSSVSGCHTEILNLTITTSTSNTSTVSACGTYTWSVNGTTYTQSGSYTSVAGCHTEYLNLTILTVPTAVITNNTASTQLTCARTSISLTASGGDTYLWSGGLGSDAAASVTSPGTYTVTVTAANGCTDTESITITQDITTPTAGITNNTGNSELTCARTSISLEASGGVSYAWSGGLGGSATASATSPATYTVTVTASNGCTDTESITITQDITTPTAVITNNTGSTELTCSRTAISLTASGAVSYVWSGGLGSNAGASVTTPGTYTVTATASNGCTDTESITITQDITAPTAVITNNTGETELTCSLTSISLEASGGISYAWSGGLGSSATASATSPATYTVTVTATNGCTDTENIVITQNITPPVAVITNNTGSAQLTCSLTSISLEASGGSPYLWSAGLGSNTSVSVTAPATYTVTVTGTNGCTDTESIIITQDITAPTAVITNNTGSTELTCSRTSISLTAGGAVSYVWSGGLGSNAGASVTSPGTYTVTATASNGCTDTESIIITQDITTPTAVITNNTGNTELTCSRTAISLTASGAVSYAWSGGLGSNATASATSPATYTVTVTATNGCTDTEVIIITQNITAATPVISAGGPTSFCDGGQVQLTSSGATSYSWSTSANTASIQVSASGSYTVTVTYSNGCTAVSAATSVTVIPNTSNASQVTDCESYTWSVNGTTYTQTGVYTSVSVCHTETLDLNLEKPRFTQHPSTMSQKSTAGIVLPAYSVAVTGGSGHTFQWYSNTIQSNAGGTLIPGAQSTIYQPSTQSVGTTYYYVKTTTSNGCQSTSNPSGFIQVCGQ